MTPAKAQERLNKIYSDIGDGNLNLSDSVSTLIETLEKVINPPKKPLSFEEWSSGNKHAIEREYEILHDEYGDAMRCFPSEYVEQKYREYLEEEKRLTPYV